MDRDDVRVREPGRRARFPQKSLAQIVLLGERSGQELDRDGAIERDVAREEDDPHAAAPELALERKSAGERFLQLEELGRRSWHRGWRVRGRPILRERGQQLPTSYL